MGSISAYIEDVLSAQAGYNDEYVAACPQCNKEGHFSFNITKRVGHCWVCGYSVTLQKLIMDMEGITYNAACAKAIELCGGKYEAYAPLTFEDAMNTLGVRNDTENVEHNTSLPECAISISTLDASPARKYLRERGFPASVYAPYNLYYVPADKWEVPRLRNHLLFPIQDENGKVIYWCSRLCGTPTKYPKSYNCAGDKPETLFGFDVWQNMEQEQLFIVEGPLDAIACCGVALLGKNLSILQAIKLAKLNMPIYICLDADATADSYAVGKRLAAYGHSDLHIVTLTDGYDPADILRLNRGARSHVTAYLLSKAAAYSAFWGL